MRILHIDSGREMGGGQWQVLHLVQGLIQRGVASRLLARGALLQLAASRGIEASEATPMSVRRWGPQFDLVHGHDAKAHAWGAAFASDQLIVARRVVFPIKEGLLSRWKYAKARRYIAISAAVGHELERVGVAASKIDIVPDGVLVPENVIPYEDRPDLFLAIAKDPALAAQARSLQLQFSARLADDLNTARCLVYLSKSEGLGSAALLAMANAVPVIASRVGGLTEAVQDGVTGVLVDDGVAVAAALERVRRDPAWAARLGLAGRERVKSKFSLDNMVDGTLRVYAKVAKGQS